MNTTPNNTETESNSERTKAGEGLGAAACSAEKILRYFKVMWFTFRFNLQPHVLFRTPRRIWVNGDEILEAVAIVLLALVSPIVWIFDLIHIIIQPLWYPFVCKFTDEQIDDAKKKLF